MCGAVLDKRLHAFPSLGNVFVIQLPEIHNVTPQLNKFSRGIILPYKSIFAFTPRIDTVLGQRLQPLLGSPSQGEREKLQLDNVSIYFLVLLHVAELDKVVEVQGSIFSCS